MVRDQHNQLKKIILTFFKIFRFDFIPECTCSFLNIVKLFGYPVILIFGQYCIMSNLIFVVDFNNVLALAFNIVFLIGTYQCLIVYFLMMIFYKKAFLKMFSYFDNFLTTDESSTADVRKKHLEENIENGLKYTKFFLTFITGGGVIINCFDLFKSNFSSPMLFLIPGIPQSNIFFYPTNIIYQITLYFAIIYMVMGVDCVIMIIICYFRGENRAIVELIRQLDDSEITQKDSSKLLKNIYEVHQIVTMNTKELLGSFWHIYFHKMITIILYLCTLLFMFQSVNANLVMALLCAVIVLGEIFILCFFGQLLQNSSEAISEALYTTKWYEMTLKDQKNILLLLTRFQRSVRIEAFGFGDISIYTFVQIIKAAASYASIAYTVFK